jgi:hypothetical protein
MKNLFTDPKYLATEKGSKNLTAEYNGEVREKEGPINGDESAGHLYSTNPIHQPVVVHAFSSQLFPHSFSFVFSHAIFDCFVRCTFFPPSLFRSV